MHVLAFWDPKSLVVYLIQLGCCVGELWTFQRAGSLDPLLRLERVGEGVERVGEGEEVFSVAINNFYLKC